MDFFAQSFWLDRFISGSHLQYFLVRLQLFSEDTVVRQVGKLSILSTPTHPNCSFTHDLHQPYVMSRRLFTCLPIGLGIGIQGLGRKLWDTTSLHVHGQAYVLICLTKQTWQTICLTQLSYKEHMDINRNTIPLL